MDKQKRIAEIEGWLSAYRNQFVAFNATHVRELQRERAELLKVS